jgi:hypothetical protein
MSPAQHPQRGGGAVLEFGGTEVLVRGGMVIGGEVVGG